MGKTYIYDGEKFLLKMPFKYDALFYILRSPFSRMIVGLLKDWLFCWKGLLFECLKKLKIDRLSSLYDRVFTN